MRASAEVTTRTNWPTSGQGRAASAATRYRHWRHGSLGLAYPFTPAFETRKAPGGRTATAPASETPNDRHSGHKITESALSLATPANGTRNRIPPASDTVRNADARAVPADETRNAVG